MAYTLEQENIFSSALNMQTNEILSITAPAGSGKTFTLVELSKKLHNSKILYLAYNKAMQIDAKKRFPKNVDVKTIHGLAFSFLNLDIKLLKNGDYTAFDISTMFNIDLDTAIMALNAFNNFCNSNLTGFKKRDCNDFTFIRIAYEFYKKMRHKEISITHNFYLKDFQLFLLKNGNQFEYDYVLLDEAQDSNEVTLSIFKTFNAKKIFVGDPNQAIYSFRGSVNAFDKLIANYEMQLSACYRCSNEIIEQANLLLSKFKKNPIIIYSKQKETNHNIITSAKITRTNANIIEQLNQSIETNFDYTLLRHPKEIFNTTLNIVHFLKNNRDKVDYNAFPFLKNLSNEIALKNLLNDMKDIELSASYKMAKRYGSYIFRIYYFALENYKNRKINKNYVLTAHTSKGLEFDKVELSADFPNIFDLKNSIIDNNLQDEQKLQEEVNLYYVAITRAKYILIDNTKNKEILCQMP